MTGLALLGGLTTDNFMRKHWQRQPLLVRATGAAPVIDRRALFALAARSDVESRLVAREGTGRRASWTLTHGPIGTRVRPPLARAGWTLLVQGVDLHVDAAHQLLSRFAFASWARLDDVMVSFATSGGGVGPHVDAYDVFLLQVEGKRRWRVGPVATPRWQAGVPLKLLQRFTPTHEWLLEPGDMLYVPPGWGHDGVCEGPSCITASVGFRAPQADELARELMLRMSDADEGSETSARYRDARGQPAHEPGRIAPQLAAFALRHLRQSINQQRVSLALGEWLTEPKAKVWFDARDDAAPAWVQRGLALDRRSRMLYDDDAIYLNGESYLTGGRDATLLRRLADQRALDAMTCGRFSVQARATIDEWVAAGWVVPQGALAAETSAPPRNAAPERRARRWISKP